MEKQCIRESVSSDHCHVPRPLAASHLAHSRHTPPPAGGGTDASAVTLMNIKIMPNSKEAVCLFVLFLPKSQEGVLPAHGTEE